MVAAPGSPFLRGLGLRFGTVGCRCCCCGLGLCRAFVCFVTGWLHGVVMSLRSGLFEQLMRVCVDESLLFPFVDAAPGSVEAFAAAGRLMPSVGPGLFVAGSPLVVFLEGGSVDRDWRRLVPVVEGCVWSRLLFLRGLFSELLECSPECPFEEFLELCLVADRDMSS